MKRDMLPPIILHAARLTGQSVRRERNDGLHKALAQASETESATGLVQKAWEAANLEGNPLRLAAPRPDDCPFLVWSAIQGWFVVVSKNADGSWMGQATNGSTSRIKDLEELECISLPARHTTEKAPSATRLIWASILKRRAIMLEGMLATIIVNTLALVTSLFSMQVYDRVIPNKGFQTLWVLSAGVVGALLMELLLKHVRSAAIEKAATRVDAELSEWFFERALGIRMECRPPSVGTLAAQIKGFEMVRGIMGSTSIFMLIDVPFAVFFIAIIAMVGGWMVIVPLVLLPVSLLTGLMFQRQISQHARTSQAQSNLKAGLLVESIDGAESLKANSADWKMQGRWNRLVEAAGESEYQIKQHSALSQHLTVSLQQIGYVALIALGAYLVSENFLTMGALIACTIVNGRALSPIAQLPGLMVQWAHARAAINGLDKLISLPNEIDDRAHALTPGASDGAIRFEQAQFSYGMGAGTALETGSVNIRPGEKVGIIGGIGSGKSTMLKLASGLYRPGSGRVFLDGIDMSIISPGFLREVIAYLPQDVRLISGTLRDNLLQGLPDPGDEVLLQAARDTGLLALLANHPKGLALPITEGGRGISGGQRQLLALTRMLLSEPTVMLLDEPTASMDAASEAKVVATLKSKAAAGITLVLATHKSALIPIVDRLLVMQDGKVAMDGPRDLVLARLSGPLPVSTPTSHKEGAAVAYA